MVCLIHWEEERWDACRTSAHIIYQKKMFRITSFYEVWLEENIGEEKEGVINKFARE